MSSTELQKLNNATFALSRECKNVEEISNMIRDTYWFADDKLIEKHLDTLTALAEDIPKRVEHLKALFKKDGARNVTPSTEENSVI